MAVWQFDVTIARTFDAKVLPARFAKFVEVALRAMWGPPIEMLDGWFVYGDKYGSRVDCLKTEGGGIELSARIDAREEADDFIGRLVTVADSMNCLFFDESGTAIAANPSDLRKAVMASDAWRFALDPKSYRPDPAAGDWLGRA